VSFTYLSPGKPSVASAQPEWQLRLEKWRRLLAQCARKPSRKCIHDLRSFTLRLRVALQHELLEQSADSSASHAFQRWNKEGKKLRRMLEPVRNADVYLTLLGGLRKRVGGASDGDTQPTPRCLREINKLENRLKWRRQAGIDKLTDSIEARRKRLNRLSNEMEEALTPHLNTKKSSTTWAALGIIEELAKEFPSLNSANLHEFRKRLKQSLYLAEISAATDPLAQRLAVAFKKVHRATGEWHDWQSLAQEASRVLPDRGRVDGLLPLLDARAEKALHHALDQCCRSAPRNLLNVAEGQPLPPRKPVAADHGSRFENNYRKVGISR